MSHYGFGCDHSGAGSGINVGVEPESRLSLLLISHDLGIISQMCDDVSIMYAGSIVETADMETFFANHRHPYSEGLIGSIPALGAGRRSCKRFPGQSSLVHPLRGAGFIRCKFTLEKCKRKNPHPLEIAPGHKVACFKVMD
jgi:oligopeptide/dipeptide ABC transporter ATP-binding protein